MNPPAATPHGFVVIIDEKGTAYEFDEACANLNKAFGEFGVTANEAATNMRRCFAAMKTLTSYCPELSPLYLYPRRGYLADTPYVLQTPRRCWIYPCRGYCRYIIWRWAPLVFDEHSSIHRRPRSSYIGGAGLSR